MQMYSTDEMIGGSHYHNGACMACLRIGVITAVSVASVVYQTLEKEGVPNFHDVMDKVCEEAGIDKMSVLEMINEQLLKEEQK